VNGICGCGLPSHYCQPAVAGGIIYADLRGELNAHLALQALFTQSSPVCETLLQAFSFPRALGKVTLHLLYQACMFVYSSRAKWVFSPLLWSFPPTTTFTSFPAPDYWAVLLLLPAAMFVYSSCGRWVFPPLLWSFPPSITLTSFPAPGCWAHTPPPSGASPAPLGLFIYSSGKDSLPSLQHSVCPTLFLMSLYCSYCLLLSFSFFLWWRSVCPGGYADLAHGCLWEYHSTAKLTLSVSS
jgi:hypothetical protein